MGPALAIALALLAQLQVARQSYRPTARVQFFPMQTLITGTQSSSEQLPHSATEVLCTMPMLRPKGDVDPRIVVEPPKDVDYKIRIVEPPPCVERPKR